MPNDFFLSIENSAQGEKHAMQHVLGRLSYNNSGLIPVIAQDLYSRDVLMLAWMNQDAIAQTLQSGFMTYWSRSRSQLWRKGETSGHFQRLKTMRIDCDGDTLLCKVEQTGPACHTRRKTCFYLEVDPHTNTVVVTDSPPN